MFLKNKTFLIVLVFSFLAACSSNEKAEEAPMENTEPQVEEVRCQAKPENCEYEIQNICQAPDKYEIIGKPIPSFFSTEVTYKVRFKCIRQ